MRGCLAWIAFPICATAACCFAPPVAADPDLPATRTIEAHESIKNRLVYIEAKRIKAEQRCDANSFDEIPPANENRGGVEKGTGFLLSEAKVLTAFHVALKSVRSGLIRCYAVYRDKSRGVRYFARPAFSPDLKDDGEVQMWRPRDLAMLKLTLPIDDESLKICPRISRKRFDEKDRVFVIGYKGNTIDIPNNRGITDPQTHPTTLLHACRPPDTCDVDQPAPAGVSGGPVVDEKDELIGVLKGGDSAQSEFQPIMDLRTTFETHCKPPVAQDGQDDCFNTEREALEQETTEKGSKRIECSAAGEASDSEPFSFTPPKGFKISGFVKHDDNADSTGNGWVGHAEYTLSDDELRVTKIKVQLGCNGQPTASGQPGWAETHVTVNTKKILETKDNKDIKAKCNAY